MWCLSADRITGWCHPYLFHHDYCKPQCISRISLFRFIGAHVRVRARFLHQSWELKVAPPSVLSSVHARSLVFFTGKSKEHFPGKIFIIFVSARNRKKLLKVGELTFDRPPIRSAKFQAQSRWMEDTHAHARTYPLRVYERETNKTNH